MGHNIEFMIGQTVYLKTDTDQNERMVVGVSLRPCNLVTYALTYSTTETWHYGIEISSERDVLKVTTN